MNFNPGVSMSPFRGLPFLPPAPVPTHQPFWELPLAPWVTAPISQSNPLVLPPYPGRPQVAELLTFGQRGTEVRAAGCPHTQNISHTQGTLIWSAAGPFCGGVEHPAPFLTADSALRTTVPASASGGTGNDGRHGHLGRPPPAPPPFAHMAPIVFPMDAHQWPRAGIEEGTLPTFQTAVPPDESSGPQSVHQNFRHWQRFKTLVRRHLPHAPDVEALSCFLIPVLRSLSRLEPTMTMEEGLRKGLQEWQRTSNFDRMIYYEIAEKFVEFEAAAELEDPRMQLSEVFQCRPLPIPLWPDPPRPPAPEAVQQPVCTSRKARPKARPARLLAAKPMVPGTNAQETKAPEEIPPEVIQECLDIIDELLGPTDFATWEPSCLSTGEPATNVGEEGLHQNPIEDDLYPDASLLSYIDEDFVNKVETTIDPDFLEQLLSSDPYINTLDITKELEQEEGLTPEQDSGSSGTAANQGAEKRKHHTDQGVSMENWTTEVASQDVKRCRATDPVLLGAEDTALLPSSHGLSSLGAMCSIHPPQNCISSSLYPGRKHAVGSSKTTSCMEPHWTPISCSVDDGLQSLDFLLVYQHHLLPWALSQSQSPHMEPFCSGDQALQAPPPQRGGLCHDPLPAATTRKRALTGHACNVEKMPCSGSPLQVSGGQDLDLEQVPTSQPQKRKRKSSGNQKKKKRVCGY